MQIVNGSTPTIVFYLVDETDSETPETGLTPTVSISKAGGNFATATNSAAQVFESDGTTGTGWYKVALTASETDTDGALIFRASASGAELWQDAHEVYTEIPADVTTLTASLPEVTVADANVREIAATVLTLPIADARTYTTITAPSDLQYTVSGGVLATAGKNINTGSAIQTYEETDTTVEFSRSTTTNAAAEPITGVG